MASSNAKADEAFGSWECLQFGICPEVASAAIAVTAGAVAVPGLVVGPARVGERSNSQECVQACEDAYAHYKNVCHEPTCVAQTSFSSDAERQNYCSQTRAKFYENAECALARFDYGGFCQIAKNFTPNQEHQYPINRSLNKAQECANAYATACGGSLSFPNGSLKYADLYNSCI